MKNEEILDKLKELADEKYKKFHTGLCPGSKEILGVRIPLIRKLAQKLAKENFRDYLKEAENKFYEETVLQGLVIANAKMDFTEKLKYIQEFVPKIDSWAVCDTFCADLKDIKKNKETMWKFIQKYFKSNKEFELRFAIIILLDYYIEEKYINEIFKIVDKIRTDKYYVQMGIAWLISVLYVKYPNETMEYLKENNLDKFTYNKSIQKIIESYRVKDESKEILRKMKR